MNYSIGFDGVLTADLERLLKAIEHRVNMFGVHAQGPGDSGATAASSGSTTPPCPPGQTCTNGVKGGHDLVIVVVTAAIVGGAAGFIAGKLGVKGGHDGVKGGHD